VIAFVSPGGFSAGTFKLSAHSRASSSRRRSISSQSDCFHSTALFTMGDLLRGLFDDVGGRADHVRDPEGARRRMHAEN
jgi:hypothetical protein